MSSAAATTTTTTTTTTATALPPPLLRRLISLDESLSLHIHTFCQPVPRGLLKALEISGDGRFWFPIPIALLPLSSIHPVLLGLLLGSLLDLLLVGLIKHLVRRPRPVYNKGGMPLTFAVDHWSFPSGHSSRVFFIAGFLYLCATPIRVYAEGQRWIRNWYGGDLTEIVLPTVFVWSALTSVSRVLLGRHFVFDVVAGASLGVFEAVIVFYLLASFRNPELL